MYERLESKIQDLFFSLTLLFCCLFFLSLSLSRDDSRVFIKWHSGDAYKRRAHINNMNRKKIHTQSQSVSRPGLVVLFDWHS